MCHNSKIKLYIIIYTHISIYTLTQYHVACITYLLLQNVLPLQGPEAFAALQTVFAAAGAEAGSIDAKVCSLRDWNHQNVGFDII